MALSEIDRELLDRCLAHKARSWEDFVDRYMGLVIHVVNHTAQCRSRPLSLEDRDDLTANVFLEFFKDDMKVFRHFRGQSSLATYLTVVARRVVVRSLQAQSSGKPLASVAETVKSQESHESQIDDKEEVERLLEVLEESEAAVVRMYHLEGKSYSEISKIVGMTENSVGPILSRARTKMKSHAKTIAG